MTRQGGNVELPCPFVFTRSRRLRKLFPRDFGRVGPYLGDGVPVRLLLILGETPSTRGTPGQFPAHRLGLDGRVHQTGPDIAGMQSLEVCATNLAADQHCEADHSGTIFHMIDITAECFLLLRASHDTRGESLL